MDLDSVYTTTTIYSCKKYSMYLGSTLFRIFLSPKKIMIYEVGTYFAPYFIHSTVHAMYLGSSFETLKYVKANLVSKDQHCF